MEKIIVNVNALQTVLSHMICDHMDVIELGIVSRQTDRHITYPAFLHLNGVTQKGVLKDYESIDEFSGYAVLNLSA